MITAAITAAVGAILNLFGIPPGPYLAGVAIVVKVILVLLGMLLAAKVARKRKLTQAAEQAKAAPAPSPAPAPADPGTP